eukprot:SAG22_NODE_652_length_8143_cov_2.399552_3_plen_1258_part_00
MPGYDDPAKSIRAVLAPVNNPYAVVRAVDLQMPDFAQHTGEWHAVLGDFHVLPAELTGSARLRLFLALGSPAASRGSCALTGLTLTTIESSNVAFLKPASGTESQAQSGGKSTGRCPIPPSSLPLSVLTTQCPLAAGDVPDNLILTNGEILSNPGQTWYRFDTNLPPTFVVDLQWKHRICYVRVEFNKAGKVRDWVFNYQNDTESDVWHEAVSVTVAQDALPTGSAEWTTAGQGSLSSPISTEARWFDCVDAYKVQLVLRETENIIYAFTEIEVGGYDTHIDAICTLGCRHGGECFNVGDSCRCVSKWGWRGQRCGADADECNLVKPSDNDMMAEVDGNGDGIVAAEFNNFIRTVLNVSDCDTCWNDLQCLLDGDENDRISSGEFKAFQVIGNVTYDGPDAAAEIGVEGTNGGCGLGNALSTQFDKASCINTPGSWRCQCNPGFSGDPSEGASNSCTDINECQLPDKGGCEHICINNQGSYRCACRTGYAIAEGSRTVCAPVCSKPCVHGGQCLLPETCVGCDGGWQGPYCNTPKCDIRVIGEDGGEVTGCYHNGICDDTDGCRDCDGGWSGSDCGAVDGGIIVLAVGLGSALPALVCLVILIVKRQWLPFQERGALLMIAGTAGQMVFVASAPAISNPGIFGVGLLVCTLGEPQCIEPENPMWGRLLPYAIGCGLWFNCVLIRCRNLVFVHLKGKVPFASVIQIAVLTGIWVGMAVLPDDVANVAGLIVMVFFLLYFVVLAIQLMPLRTQITDILGHVLCGTLVGLALVAMNVLRMVGLSYANPDGGINVIFPLAIVAIMDLHLVLATVRLIWKLIRKDKGIIAQYAEGGDAEDDTAQSRWKKGLRSAKIGAIIKLNTDEDDADPKAGRKGGLLGLLKKKNGEEESASEEDTPSEASEETEESEESESSSSDSDSSEDAAIVGGRGGRGRGRGRSRGRGRWSRASRGRARALMQNSPIVQKLPDKDKPDKGNQVWTAAMLFQAVSKQALPGSTETSGNFDTFAPQNQSDDESSDTDSDDSEMEALEQEVSRFEGLLANKIQKVNKQTGEVYVPKDAPFHGSEMGSGFSARMGLDMQLKQRVVEKELQPLYDPADDAENRQAADDPYSDLQSIKRQAAAVAAASSDSGSDSDDDSDDGFDFSDCEYAIDIQTGKDPNAGTTANVWVDIVGDHGDTGEVFLRNPAIATPFLPAQRDSFTIEWPDLGTLKEVRIGHDRSGSSPSWQVGSVKVRNTKSGQTLTFTVGSWIEESGDAISLK